MSPILGIFASQGRVAANSYESIATSSAGGSSSITFSSIPSTFKHLQIRSISQSGSGNSTDSLRVQFNGDTGANYAYHALYGTGATAAATANTGNNWAKSGQLALSTTSFAGGVIDILDYTNTNKYKTLRCLSGVDFNGSGVIALESNLWLNTAAITSITISYGANFATGTTFALYGIKG